MKKLFVLVVIAGFLYSCQQTGGYKPGFGDLMGSVQIHHNKLWFAGVNNNWPLAEFALHEIEEIFEDMSTYHADEPEVEVLPMIHPALEAMHQAIDERDPEKFKEGYLILSSTCNACHAATGYEFIKIIVPTTPAFSNQDFSPSK